jgi:hypothetical protein
VLAEYVRPSSSWLLTDNEHIEGVWMHTMPYPHSSNEYT